MNVIPFSPRVNDGAVSLDTLRVEDPTCVGEDYAGAFMRGDSQENEGAKIVMASRPFIGADERGIATIGQVTMEPAIEIAPGLYQPLAEARFAWGDLVSALEAANLLAEGAVDKGTSLLVVIVPCDKTHWVGKPCRKKGE